MCSASSLPAPRRRWARTKTRYDAVVRSAVNYLHYFNGTNSVDVLLGFDAELTLSFVPQRFLWRLQLPRADADYPRLSAVSSSSAAGYLPACFLTCRLLAACADWNVSGNQSHRTLQIAASDDAKCKAAENVGQDRG